MQHLLHQKHYGAYVCHTFEYHGDTFKIMASLGVAQDGGALTLTMLICVSN